MSFIWPWMLAALVLLPIGVAAYVVIGRRRGQRFAAGMGSAGRVRAASGWADSGGSGTGGVPDPSGRRRSWGRRLREAIPAALAVVALTFITISLARPEAVVSLPRPEGTLILSIDVSGSMAADDVAPSRLEVAKALARELVARRPEGVVMGVVAFGDSGLSVQVPTTDQVALERAIDRLDPTFGTSLGEGLVAALEAIANMDAGTPIEYYSDLEPAPSAAPGVVEPGSRTSTAIVLFSDGENTAPPEPAEVILAASQRGIAIHSVAVGTVAGTELDLDGFRVHTRLDEALMQAIAERTAGAYHALDPEATELGDAVDLSSVLDALRPELVVREEHLEVTSLVAGAGVLLLVAATVLSLAFSGRLP